MNRRCRLAARPRLQLPQDQPLKLAAAEEDRDLIVAACRQEAKGLQAMAVKGK